ncbi:MULTISPECIES: hypothetical protein [Streptomyces]|uniref:hypothetical protein n=1 Tax=Streptomyces TaxID=1883 RepID=UPI00073DD7F9|nr:hypothetical protein [Streptomyces sp. EAS-AB2608]BCM66745.1 hypothetical protein EASAB2608_02079 [Streptomyces sp. EAS-AB2608]CUW28322.1 hypothetical protein TUE45_03053 [Streptomyces reticuli]
MRTSLAAAGVFLLTAVSGTACTPAMATAGAGAATGVLVVNGVPHVNPHGCYPAGGFLVSLVNNTDRTAYVYPTPGCAGQYEGWVQPGGRAQMNGASVSID